MIKKATLLKGLALSPNMLDCAVYSTLYHGDNDQGRKFDVALMKTKQRWWAVSDVCHKFWTDEFDAAATGPRNLRGYHARTLVRWAFQAGYLAEASKTAAILRELGIWKDP